MESSASQWTYSLTADELEPIVCQVVEKLSVKVLDWQFHPLAGGIAENYQHGLGIYRVSGTARADSQEISWSLVVKAMKPAEEAHFLDPQSPNYWKREILVYQSGVLDQLPGDLVAPRCYAVEELPDGACRIWLEDIHETDRRWTLEQHQLAARHLGQFNGAYLAGHPLPAQATWQLQGRLQQSVKVYPLNRTQLLQFSEAPLVDRWLPVQGVERVWHLWEQRQQLLDALENLPTCFCHHDAFRRNLMLRRNDDRVETVAFDWSYAGLGSVGQEIGITVAVDLLFMEFPARRAKELDEAIFAAYSDGLRDAGWQGDLRLARYGYAVTAALFIGGINAALLARRLQSPSSGDILASTIGFPIDDILEQWALMQPFLLDLGDEALTLVQSI